MSQGAAPAALPEGALCGMCDAEAPFSEPQAVAPPEGAGDVSRQVSAAATAGAVLNPNAALAPASSLLAAHESGHTPPATRRGASSAAFPSSDPAVLLPPRADAPAPKSLPVITPATGEDCGQCMACLDKPKFGGQGRKRKGCFAKRTGNVVRPAAAALLESAVRAPALNTPSLDTPDGSTAAVSSDGDGTAAAAVAPSSLPLGSSSSACPASGGSAAELPLPSSQDGRRELQRERVVGLREQLLRKEYSLRKRGAAAGELILGEDPTAAPTPDGGDVVMLVEEESSSAMEDDEVFPEAEGTPAPRAAAVPVPAAAPATCAAAPAEASASASASTSELPAALTSSLEAAAAPAAAAAEAAAPVSPTDSKAAAPSAAGGSAADGGRAAGAGGAGGSARDASSFSTVRLVGVACIDEDEVEGEGGTRDAPPGSEQPVSQKRAAVPGTPQGTPQLKTPEIEALASEGALGASPLSQFASLLDMTPRLPEQQAAGGSMSPLWQLADLMEKTPRLPDESAAAAAAAAARPAVPSEAAAAGSSSGTTDAAPADPEQLKDALLDGGLESPAPRDSAGQLRRDLRGALLQAGELASPAMMPPPPVPLGAAQQAKARKRKLETDLSVGTNGVFADLGEGEDEEERLLLRDLLASDSLGLPIHGGKPPIVAAGGGKRKQSKPKEKGKPQRCRCDRSGCLKRYCVCFAAGNPCVSDTSDACKCKGCENDDATEERKAKREAAVAEMQKKKSNAFQARIGGDGEQVHLTGCNCKKSGCQRRYCECFQAGVKCTEKCKCCECKNPAGVNPIYRSAPPPPSGPQAKNQPTSPGGTAQPGGGVETEGGSPRADAPKNSPLKELILPLKPPSPTAVVDGSLIAAAAAAAAMAAEGEGSDAMQVPTRPPSSSTTEAVLGPTAVLGPAPVLKGGAARLLVDVPAAARAADVDARRLDLNRQESGSNVSSSSSTAEWPNSAGSSMSLSGWSEAARGKRVLGATDWAGDEDSELMDAATTSLLDAAQYGDRHPKVPRHSLLRPPSLELVEKAGAVVPPARFGSGVDPSLAADTPEPQLDPRGFGPTPPPGKLVSSAAPLPQLVCGMPERPPTQGAGAELHQGATAAPPALLGADVA